MNPINGNNSSNTLDVIHDKSNLDSAVIGRRGPRSQPENGGSVVSNGHGPAVTICANVKDTFPLETAHKPHAITDAIERLADCHGISRQAVLQMALAATSAALQGKAMFQTKRYGNVKPANLFSLVILPVSAGKSPVQEWIDRPFAAHENLMKPKKLSKTQKFIMARDLDLLRSEIHKLNIKRFNSKFNSTPSDKLKDSVFHVNDKTDKELQNLIDAEIEWTKHLTGNYEPGIIRLNDSTAEDLAKSSQDDQTIYVSTAEFTSMLSIMAGKYAKDRKQNSTSLIHGWNGEDCRQGRISNDRKNARPNIAINALIQPGEMLPYLNKNLLSQGFLQRFLMFYQDKEIKPDYNIDSPDVTKTNYYELLTFLIGHFEKLSFDNGLVLPLSTAAEAYMLEITKMTHKTQSGAFGEWLNKANMQICKLACVFDFWSMTKDASGNYVLPCEISENSMLLAIQYWCDAFGHCQLQIAMAENSGKQSQNDSGNYPVPGVYVTTEDFISLLKTMPKPPSESNIKDSKSQLNKEKEKRKDFLEQLEQLGHVKSFTDNRTKYYFPNEFDLLKKDELSILDYYGLPSDTPTTIKINDKWTIDIEPGNRWTAKRFNKVQKKEVIKTGKGFFSFFADIALPGNKYYNILQRYQDNIENNIHDEFELITDKKAA